ncbi:MAG: methyl-accepting chemotaxis protein [Nitrospirae bacterium]|nr:methyl-accepting chemotaxis protein [Nitrospirota bacterium]
MNFYFSDIPKVVDTLVNNTRVRRKAILRILPYAALLTVIIIYFMLHNVSIIKHSENVLRLTKPDSATNIIKKTGDNTEVESLIASVKKIEALASMERIFIAILFLSTTILLYIEFMSAVLGIRAAEKIVGFAEKIAKGDLAQQDLEISHTGMNKLKDSLNIMKRELAEITQQVSCAIHRITDVSGNLLASSEVIARDTKDQVSNTVKVASAVEMMSVVVYDVTRNSGMAASSAKEAAVLAVKGGEVVAETIKGMNNISRSVKESADTIEALGTRSQQIGEIIKVIDDIANQTNLLALNAAIEAARAGEQGRGFAVVADEVRKLAERTTSATNEISGMIKSIQQETQNAVSSMHSATKEVESGVNMANQADDSLKQIVASVQDVMDMVQQIDTAAKQQSSTGEDVSTDLQEISNENQRTADVAQKYYGMTLELGDITQELKALISHFGTCTGLNAVEAVNCPRKKTNGVMFDASQTCINPS